MARPLRAPLLLLAILALTWAMPLAKNSKRVGGIKEADVNNEGVQQRLDFATSKHNKENDEDEDKHWQGWQVLFRLAYSLYMEISQTICNKSQANLDNCPFQEQPHLKRE
nr:cystatin-C-like [Microcebus murinus]